MDLGKVFGDLDLDRMRDAVDTVADNKEALALLSRLPGYLQALGEGLAGAGDQARGAATALAGDDGESGIRGTLSEAAEALAGIAASIGAGVRRIADAAEAAAKVPLMDGPAERLAGAAGDLGETTDRLDALAGAMESIGDTLGDVATALAKLGDHLDSSGEQARGFASLA